jgi:hypothetical protein
LRLVRGASGTWRTPRDLPDDEYDCVRDEIERRVLALIEELSV